MPKQAKTFACTEYNWSSQANVLHFSYSVTFANGSMQVFTEKLELPKELSLHVVPEIMRTSVLQNIHLVLGMSYWKLFCPSKIEISQFSLTREQAEFWNTVYTKGLGEFFYKNKIDFRGLVKFPYKDHTTAPIATMIATKDKSLVPVGGGKDSIVTAEYLKEIGKSFDVFLLNEHSLQTQVVETVGTTSMMIKRWLNADALKLAGSGQAYRGHIPVTAIYSMIGVLVAVARGHRYLILSNERSANYGNVRYLGEEINHQWSKSEEFEAMFFAYVHRYITPSVTPFSLLRPYYEIEVVRRFAQYPQYFSIFSSCNKNFAIGGGLKNGKLWCCDCPKCAFVFTMLSAFLPTTTVKNIFGENLLNKPSLVPIYRELLGLETAKPFECVGTPDEMVVALSRVAKKGEHTRDIMMQMFQKEVHVDDQQLSQLEEEVFARHDDHRIPQEFR